MIRKSGTIAAIAVLISLVAHLLLGVSITWSLPSESQPNGGETSTEIVTPGSAFEDLADTADEPIEPEPEPPVEAEPDPEPIDVPTSQALIASETPQQDVTPDIGTEQAVEPETAGPSEPETGDTPEPTTIEPAGAEEGEAPDPNLTPPAGTDTVTDIPQGEPAAPAEASEVPDQTIAVITPTPQAPAEPPIEVPAEPPTEVPAETQPAEVPAASSAAVPPAAVPAPAVAPVQSVAVTPVAPSVPVVSLPPSEIEGEAPSVTAQPEPEAPQESVETVETVEALEVDPSDTAVRSSLRPQLPTKRPTPKPNGFSNGSSQTTTARRAPAPRIESPLTAYKRDGSNIFGQQGGGARSGGQGFRNSRNTGNSSTTNYAGQVLAQLNRTSPVAVSGRGWARVLFQINPDGTLGSVVVVDSSGSRSIDRGAVQQVRAAGRFPRPPGGQSRRLNFFYRIQ